MDSNAVQELMQPFERFKSKIINNIIIIGVIFAFPLLGISISRSTVTGWNWIYSYNIIAAITTWILFLLRKRISNRYMAKLICLLLILTACIGLYNNGVLYQSKLFLLGAVIFAGLFIGRKQAYIILGLVFFILTAFAWLYLSDRLQYNYDVQVYINQPSIWLTSIFTVIFATFGLQIITNKYVDYFIISEKQIRENQKLLKQSEERYRMLVETMNDGLGVLNTQNKLTYINKALCNMLEYTCDKVIGSDVMDFFDDKNREIIRKQLELRKKGISEPYVIEWTGKNKKKIITHMSPQPIYNEKGDYEGSFAVVTDITESKRAEKNLKESEQRYRLIVENAVSVILALTADCRITEFNPEAERIFGRKKEEVLGKNYLELFIPEDIRDEVANDIKKVLKGEPTRGFENEILSHDGTRYNMVWNVNRILDETGAPAGIIAIGNDITARKEAEEQLRLTKFGIDHSHIGIFQVNDDGNIYYANEHACKSLGYSQEELLNLKIWDIDPNLDSKKWVVHRKKTRSLGHSTIETIHRKKDGSEFPVEVAIDFLEFKNKKYSFSFAKDITERKRAEQDIRESEERYKRLAEASFEGIGITKEGKIIDVNDQICSIYGYKPEEFIQLGLAKLVHPDDREMVLTYNRNNVTIPYTHRGIKKDGSLLYLEIRADKIKINNEDHRLTVIRDVTEYKKAEQALKESEEKFRNIFNNSIDPIVISDFRQCILDANQIALETLGITREKLIGKKTTDFVDNPYKMILLERLEKLKTKSLSPVEIEITTTKNIRIPAEINSKKIEYEGKDAILTILRDITERKKATQALRESEERFRLLIENIPAVTWVTSQEGKTTYISPNIEKVYGYTAEEIYKGGSRLWLDRIHPEDADIVKKEFKRLFTKDKGYNIEYRIKRKDGSWIWLHDRANLFQEFNGILYAYGVFSDITIQKNAELKIKENEKQYRTLYENANDAIFLVKDNVIIDCNPKTLDLFGCESQDIIGKKLYELSPGFQPDNRNSKEKANKLIEKTLSDVPQRFEWIHKRKDGFLFTAEVSLNSIELKNEKFLLALVRDITEIKEKHKEILRAVIKAEEKERNRIATDIHDGVAPILSTIKLLSQSMAQCEDEKLQKNLVARIENAVREAITSLSEISIKLSPHILQNFGVVEAIRNFVREISSIKNIKFNFKTSLKERLNENIEITIYRIVIELINNTLKHADASQVDIILLRNGNISLTYKDNGKGFDIDKTLKRKKGMGLHNLKTRIESVNGTYIIRSTPGRGIRLNIIIPQNE